MATYINIRTPNQKKIRTCLHQHEKVFLGMSVVCIFCLLRRQNGALLQHRDWREVSGKAFVFLRFVIGNCWLWCNFLAIETTKE